MLLKRELAFAGRGFLMMYRRIGRQSLGIGFLCLQCMTAAMRLRGPRRKPCLLRPSLRFSCTDSGSDGSMESDGFKAVSGVTSERFLNVSASSLAIRAVSVVARQGGQCVKRL